MKKFENFDEIIILLTVLSLNILEENIYES